MGFKKTLSGIITSALVAGSSIIGLQEANAQKAESRGSASVIQLEPNKTRDLREIPVELFQYQQHNQKLVSSGETTLPIYAEMDYKTGQLLVTYSSGKMTDEGPDLSGFSRRERERSPVAQLVPRLNDSHTLAVVVSSCSEGIEIQHGNQMGWLVGAKENPVRLVPSGNKLGDKVLLYAGNEGMDELIDFCAVKLSGGLTGGWDELVDLVDSSDRYKVDASGRARRFLEGLRDNERKRQEGHAESSLENGVSMGFLDLHKDPRPDSIGRHMVARSIDLSLRNNTFEDQEVTLYFNQVRIGEKSSQDSITGISTGSRFGDVRDIAVRVKLPVDPNRKYFLGDWRFVEVNEGGLEKELPEEFATENVSFKISPRFVELKRTAPGRDSTQQHNLAGSLFGGDYLLFYDSGIDSMVFFKKLDNNRIAFGDSSMDKSKVGELFQREKFGELEENLKKGHFVLERGAQVVTPPVLSRVEDYIGSWRGIGTVRGSRFGEDTLSEEEKKVRNEKIASIRWNYGPNNFSFLKNLRTGELETTPIDWFPLPIENYIAHTCPFNPESYRILRKDGKNRLNLVSISRLAVPNGWNELARSVSLKDTKEFLISAFETEGFIILERDK